MKRFIIISIILFLFSYNTKAQNKNQKENKNKYIISPSTYKGLGWRSIGPFRGGRSAAVTGVKGKPNLYYMGAAGGGVWKSHNGGNSWENISDGFFGGSIGAVAVSEWDNNVIYVGGGEVTVRGNVSYGYGVHKSEDAGATWKHMGLPKSKHIPRIRIHPKNPDIVFAAVLGDLYQSSSERGVYRTNDGGKNWEQVLFVNSEAGAADLVLDPNNPRILYATTWKIRRTPYSLESGGEGSSIWKSTDGGHSWSDISSNKGLPIGLWGISGIAVSPVNSNRLWAIIEHKNGGVYRSDDAGKSWELVNKERKLRQRAWYYTRIYADPQDEDRVYVLNVSYHRSKDGGKTYETFNAPHGDHHDLWIDPEDNERMIIGDDGGAQVSYDGGENWSTYHNQPTAQFYRVTTDNAFPYRIYGAQQDNSTVRISHRVGGGFIGERSWEPTAGGESAHLAIDPKDNEIVYGGSYDGFLTRVDHNNDQIRAINVWPDNPMGHGAEGMRYRFQWNFPIFFSPHDPNKLYTTSNHVHVSKNEGQSWEIISPDLTRNDSSKLGPSGGPITKDNTSVEYYGTIFSAVESYHEEGVIWTGSDDGLIYITKNGGIDWVDVTPEIMPEWSMINSLEIDPFNKKGLYVAGTRYKMGDYQPYLYKTSDYGITWEKITDGIAKDHFTRVLRADPKKRGILYAGTESGVYISFNEGQDWQALQMNLPIVPITDLAVKENNLIAATQGRSFWIIDDLTVLHQMNPEIEHKTTHLFKPMDSYRLSGNNGKTSKTAGTDHYGGVLTHFWIKDTSLVDTVRIEFLELDGNPIISYSTHHDKERLEKKLDIKSGLNTISWDMRYKGAKKFEGLVMWWATMEGPKAVPGNYKVKMTVNGQLEQEQTFVLNADPRSPTTQEEYLDQFKFLLEVRDKLSETHQAIIDIRKVRKQIESVTSNTDDQGLKEYGENMITEMGIIEKALYQTKNESRQDPLNFPIRLNNKLGHLASLEGMGNYPPTTQSKDFFKEVTERIDDNLIMLKEIFNTRIGTFNEMVRNAKVEAVQLSH